MKSGGKFDLKRGKKGLKMLEPTSLYEQANLRYKDLNRVKKYTEKELRKATAEKVRISKSSKGAQFYIKSNKEDRKWKYISKKNKEVIKKGVQKAYDEKVLKLICKEMKALSNMIEKLDLINLKIRDVYSNNLEEVKGLITPVDMSDEDFVNNWLREEYVGKEISDDIVCYETDNHEHVRSKSELNIANALFKHRIPYKYECPLEIDDTKTIYPDFTILDVKNRRVKYWEHRGMMDNMNYSSHAVYRIKDYLRNGIYIGDNLIISEESKEFPLGTNEIEQLIRVNFL